jgi:hypothetical protein
MRFKVLTVVKTSMFLCWAQKTNIDKRNIYFTFVEYEKFINLSFVSEATNPTMPPPPPHDLARSNSVVEYSALISLGSLLEKPIETIPVRR